MSASLLDRHRTLQIMLNLLNNAWQALSDVAGDRLITVTLRHAAPDRITIGIEDTGCGIAAETLSKLFQHGFTTKPDGHGFGLHSSTCLTTEMGGSLVATSDGPSRGARFTLGVPCGLHIPKRKRFSAPLRSEGYRFFNNSNLAPLAL